MKQIFALCELTAYRRQKIKSSPVRYLDLLYYLVLAYNSRFNILAGRV